MDNASKSQISSSLLKTSPFPALLLPGDPTFRHLHVVYSCPFAFSETVEGGVIFTGSYIIFWALPRNKLNLSIFLLSSHYSIYKRRIHNSYTHIFGTTERDITLIDCQLLSSKSSIVSKLSRRNSSSMKGNQPSQIFQDFISSYHQLLHFPYKMGNHQICSLFGQVFQTDNLCDILWMALC